MPKKLTRLTYQPKGLELTDAEFDALHRELAGVRKSSSTVRVDKAALAHLLSDHSLLFQRFEEVDMSLRHLDNGKVEARPVDG